MSKIVEANPSQSIFLQQPWESHRQIFWTKPDTQFIDTNVVQVVIAVRPSTELPIDFLLFHGNHKFFFESGNQGQGPHAGFVFG